MLTQRKINGVTLIELMVVVSIIGILSVVTRSKFIDYREQFKVERAKADMKVLEMAIKDHYKDTGLYPLRYKRGKDIQMDDYNIGNSSGASATLAAFLTDATPMGGFYSMKPWEWALIRGTSMETSTDTVATGWMGPYLFSTPYDPWGHRYILVEAYEDSARTSFLLCMGPKGAPNGTEAKYGQGIPLVGPSGVNGIQEVAEQKANWSAGRDGFVIIPKNGNTSMYPDFMRPLGTLADPLDDDYGIVLWME